MTGQAPGMRLAEGEAEGLRWAIAEAALGELGAVARACWEDSRRQPAQLLSGQEGKGHLLSGLSSCLDENKLDESLDSESTARIIDVSRGRIAAEGAE
jgi:hypothetical protein